MSMEQLQAAAIARFEAMLQKCHEISRGNRIMPAIIMADGRVLPPVGAQQVGERQIEINAAIFSYEKAIEIMHEELKRIVDPGAAARSDDNPLEPPPSREERVY